MIIQDKTQFPISVAKGFVFLFRQVMNVFYENVSASYLFIRDLYYTIRKSYLTFY